MNLPCVEVEPKSEARFAILCLHGLGADGYDLAPLAEELLLEEFAPVRWVFPHAPAIPVTLNGGMKMPAWYDIKDISALKRDHDAEGVTRSRGSVDALIQQEIGRGIPSEQIFLAGFSQGGAIALYAGLRQERRLAGIIGLSTYLLFEDEVEDERSDANRATPIFLGHGTMDPVVPLSAGRRAFEHLSELGHAVEFKSYPMAHAIHPMELSDLRRWLSKRLVS